MKKPTKIVISIIISCVILVFVFATVMNPWHNTRWGGDTGEETYQVQPEPEPEPEEEDKFGKFCCTSYIPPVGIVFVYAIQRRLKR
jgi:hypothetical protein